MKYVSLHHHTTYSYADGFGSPDAHFKRAADLGMSAMAVTEHGNVSSQVKASLAAEKYGLKPIHGLEAYTAPIDMRETKNTRKWHLTLLAMNEEGHFNLNQIVSRSWAEGFYRWPTVTGNILKDHHQGLIVLSGCADSMLACNLLGGKGIETGDERRARKVIERFKRLLGDRYYLETQQFPELGRTKQLNEWYEQMSKRYGVPLVATSDCHYPMPEDNGMQRILHAANRGLGTVAAALLAFEGHHFVHSRTGLLDVFVMFFGLAAFGALLIDRDVLILLADIRPDFVALDTFTLQVPQSCILIDRTGRPGFDQEPHDGVPRDVGHSGDRPNASSLDQGCQHLRPVIAIQPVHTE